MQEWDAIVVGASFAGLGAAMELAGHGRVLLIDKDPIGEHQTSACATPLAVLERLRVTETIEQVHDTLVIHLPGGRVRTFRPRFPFATFDYRALCQALARSTDADVLRARVTGLRDGVVETAGETHRAPIVIDASGWRAVVGVGIAPETLPGPHRTNGLETVLPGEPDGLHFWVGDPLAADGYLWDFPAGGKSRIGLIRYASGGALKPRLEEFVERSVEGPALHGGVLPAGLRRGVAGHVFLAGDAAGLCLPLTGEGIRPALVFGQIAGRLAARVLDRQLTLDDALAAYAALLADRRLALKFGILALVERRMRSMPARVIDATAWYFGAGPMAARCQAAYWRIAPAEWLRPGVVTAGRAPVS
ncbi:MAG: NAD(P)/FAD-dependent oxidoreductase [Candidatus Dormibacteraeota bacterium]|nr:NAD(P)/FAD-dependent oxidoreductase [Candidatus Dormibacteraeota bacterium]